MFIVFKKLMRPFIWISSNRIFDSDPKEDYGTRSPNSSVNSTPGSHQRTYRMRLEWKSIWAQRDVNHF